MDNLRTVVSPTPSSIKMGISDRILTIGSCFAGAMGKRFVGNKMMALSNPFGTSYNPDSIHKLLGYAVSNEFPGERTFLKHQDVFLNYDFHSELSSLDRDLLDQRLREAIGTAHYFAGHADWIIVTYGTSWVYERYDTGEVVSNCHKQPSSAFSKSILPTDRIEASFDNVYQALKKVRPQIKFILTVSPVRHVKDTLEGNSISKAILRTACHELSQKYRDVSYFPAYEMMVDDLRDYRFYTSDLIHPTELAEDYIWDKFADCYFDASLKSFIGKWQDIKRLLDHKPFHPASRGHRAFLIETLKKLTELKSTVNVESELLDIHSQLQHHEPKSDKT